MECATQALLQAELASVEQVISDYAKVAALGTRAEEGAITLLALQQPVAGELRSIISWIHVIADFDRMGALAVHVAKLSGSDIQTMCCPSKSRATSPKWVGLQLNWRTVRRKCCQPVIQARRLA